MKSWEDWVRELREVFKRSDLLYQLTRADLGLQYRTKSLGVLWAVLDPILLMVTYYILIKVIFNRGGENYAALIFSSIIAWRWFVQSALGSVRLFTSNAQLIQTVKFPHSVLPISRNLVNTFNYLAGLLSFIPIFFIFDIIPTANLLWLPLIVAIQFILNLGVSLCFAILGVYFRDLYNIMTFALRLIFYLSPGLYMIADLPAWLQNPMIWINPFASLFESYKNVLVLGESATIQLVIPFLVGSILTILALNLISNQNRLTKDI